MNFNKFLQSLFGNKSSRDMKLIQPIVEKVKAEYPNIKALSNDQLRAKTKEIQQYVQNAGKAQREKIAELKATIEDTPIDQREDIFNQIDKLEKEALDNYEVALNEVLPTAFSIVKDTARRFAENEETVVTATEFDRELAANPANDFITIDGDNAISGKWFTTTYSSSVVRCCTRVRLPRWLRVKVRPSSLHCLCSSTPSLATVCTWLP